MSVLVSVPPSVLLLVTVLALPTARRLAWPSEPMSVLLSALVSVARVWGTMTALKSALASDLERVPLSEAVQHIWKRPVRS